MFVGVSGPDGSGKSTFTRALADGILANEPDREVVRLWMRWSPRPSRTATPDGVVSTVDRRHKGNVVKRAVREAGGRRLWAAAAVTQYRQQLLWQLGAVPENTSIVADRFSLDFVADLIAGGILRETEAVSYVRRVPTADVNVVLTVPDDVLTARADPNEDPARLVERARLYLRLAERVGAVVVDGRAPGAVADVLGGVRG